jgi:hypothetical protein
MHPSVCPSICLFCLPVRLSVRVCLSHTIKLIKYYIFWKFVVVPNHRATRSYTFLTATCH